MSNKTTLQTNNTNLASYSDRVAALINVANSLPEAGGTIEDLSTELTTQDSLLTELATVLASKASGGSGGGSAETCVGEIIVDAPLMGNFSVYHLNENLQATTITIDKMGGQFTAAKGTIVAITPWSSMYNISGNCTECFAKFEGAAFIVTGDFTLTYQG